MVRSSASMRIVAAFAALFSLGAAVPSVRLAARDTAFDYNTDKIRGVNLGGWL